MIYLVLLPVFFLLMLLYFRIADHFNIIDKPNERSSHTRVTIRGGGVLFVLSIVFAGMLHIDYWLPVAGTIIIGTISFLDDRITLSGRVRIVFHLLAVTCIFYFLKMFGELQWWWIIGAYIFVIGIINAYNFMDGINGITGLYSLVVLGGLQYVNVYQQQFIEPDMIWLPMLSCCVFLWFNFRKRAKCFAGDVGSVSIAFWIVFLMLKLIISTGNYSYILFLAVYGTDSVLTILHRLYLKQNIFEAHRLHFYQILANDQRISHLLVSSTYAILQLLIIVFIVSSKMGLMLMFVSIVAPLGAIYCIAKPKLMTSKP